MRTTTITLVLGMIAVANYGSAGGGDATVASKVRTKMIDNGLPLDHSVFANKTNEAIQLLLASGLVGCRVSSRRAAPLS